MGRVLRLSHIFLTERSKVLLSNRNSFTGYEKQLMMNTLSNLPLGTTTGQQQFGNAERQVNEVFE